MLFLTDGAQLHTEDHTQEGQAVKDNDGPKDKETSAKRRSTSTEKQPPETKKGIASYYSSRERQMMSVVFALPDTQTDKETDKKWVVLNCVEVFILQRDRHQHRLGSVLICQCQCLSWCLAVRIHRNNFMGMGRIMHEGDLPINS